MNKNKSKEKDMIETLEINLRHLENQNFVVKEQYEKTTEEYFKILDEISNANKQLQQEIAERKKVEEALRKAHDDLEIRVQERTAELAKANEELKNYITEIKKYKFMVDSAHDAIFFKDLESRYIIANDETLESFGLSREEVIGKNDYELMPIKGEAKNNIEDDQLVFKTAKLSEIIKHMTGADRKEYWFQAIKVPQFDEKGNIIGLVGIARDITEQKKAEEVIKKARDDYLAITNLTGDIIVNIDQEGKRTFLNDGACKFWGKTREELMRNAFADYLHPDDHEKTMTAIQEMSDSRDIVRGHVDRQKTPRGWRIVEWNAAPFFDKSENYLGMQATGRDITERKKTEEILKFTQKELEIKAKNLEETNTALKVLLKHQDTEKNIIEKNILTSLKTLVLPYLEKIKISTSDKSQKTYINIIETNLSEITKPFASRLTEYYSKLTPTEIQITSLIRENKTAKDISRILNISETTVFFHRRNIRKKFGLKNKKANLQSYLQSVVSF